MSERAFKAWGEQAAKDRDDAIKQVKKGLDRALAEQVIERLREKLNRQ